MGTLDDGYFPRGRSVLRHVHEQRAVGLFYGQRALMIGALNPRAFVGTIQHTRGRVRPFRRLAHTAHAFETIFFGTRAEADEVLATVGKMHDRVSGVLPEDAGATPAGSPYSAYDPDLMLWTMAVIADSGPAYYELLVRRLDDDEREILWQDYVRFGELFGMPREAAPGSWREFRVWFDAELVSERMHLTPAARYLGHATALEIPLPMLLQPAKRVHDLITLGALPAAVRDHYDLRWTPAHAAAFRAVTTAIRAGRIAVPGSIREGRNTDSFKLVARTERERIAHGQETPQLAG
jgi:uncharacterized protein (DUF2236 family)